MSLYKGCLNTESVRTIKTCSNVEFVYQSSEEWMERRAAARLEDPGTPSETESEDEPILYRDTLPDQGMITPPSGFASPTGDRNPPNLVSFYFLLK